VTEFNPKVLEIAVLQGHTKLLLRIQAVKADGVQTGGGQAVQAIVASMVQIWTEEPDGWRITASRRSDFSADAVRRLPQPAQPNPDLYADPKEAEAELKEASGVAAREHKRVLVVFGANWCYDCHVLDLAFHRPDFAAAIAGYEVVHVDLGEDETKNADVVKQFDATLEKGIPTLAVAESDGKVVASQKNGEFEDARSLTPEILLEFLNKWKPEAR